jgi:hypothetical protein
MATLLFSEWVNRRSVDPGEIIHRRHVAENTAVSAIKRVKYGRIEGKLANPL